MDIRIGEVNSEVTVTDGVGTLSPEDVRRLVALVLEQLRHDQERAKDREADTSVSDRVFPRGRGA